MRTPTQETWNIFPPGIELETKYVNNHKLGRCGVTCPLHMTTGNRVIFNQVKFIYFPSPLCKLPEKLEMPELGQTSGAGRDIVVAEKVPE